MHRCPHCHNPIEDVPELAGQAVTCPICGGTYRAPESTPAAASPFVTTDPRVDRFQRSRGMVAGGKKRGSRNQLPLLVATISSVAVLALATIGGIGFWAYSISPYGSPGKSLRQVQGYAAEGRWDLVYDRIDRRSQGKLDMGLELLAGFASAFDPTTRSQLSGVKGKELFVRICSRGDNVADRFAPAEIISWRFDSATEAHVIVRNADGKRNMVPMVLEDGIWKLTLE